MAKARFIISSSFQAPDILPNKLAHVLEQLREQNPLLKFLTEKDGNFDCHPYQDVIVTYQDQSLLLHSASTSSLDISPLNPSNYEEADTRIFLHCNHASINGPKFAMISTVDSDVV